jgi:hypothetical protein
MNHESQATPAQSSASPEETKTAAKSKEEQLEDLATSSTNSALFLEVLEKALSSPITKATFEEITRAGSMLMDEDALGLVLVAATTDDDEYVPKLELSSKALDLLLRIVALYGGSLRQALHASTAPASRGNDWRSFSAETYIDLKDQQPVIEMEVKKFNGEKLEIRGNLTSTIILVENILLAVMTVKDMDEVTPDHRKRVHKLFDELRARLSVDGDSDSAEGASEAESS